MTLAGTAVLVAIAIVAVASALIGQFGVRFTRSTSDFFVAARTVGPMANASAISGEYLSAASFLGVAGLILRDGVDALWYPLGYTAGYLALALFVSAPLRRSGAYTVPDFAEFRLLSLPLRRVCAVFVVVIGWLYVLPQFQGAGLTLATVTGLPMWVGAAVAAAVVVATVMLGGMRSITFVQAFQYWLKISAVLLPAIVAGLYFLGDTTQYHAAAPPRFTDTSTVDVRTDVELETTEPVTVTATGSVDGAEVTAATLVWQPGVHTVAAGTELVFPSGSAVPVAAGTPATTEEWLNPTHESRAHGLLSTYSLMLALFLGALGMPHVLVRFYTNPDGRAARRTAVYVLALLGGFYLTVILLGVLSRLYTPQLLVSGNTDAAVLLLPTAILGSGWAGALLGGLVAAGAWAAFLSTSSGLIVSVAGVLCTDLFGGSRRVRDFRIATLLGGAAPLALAIGATRLDFSEAVALVFAVAASAFCPLLVLGIWWRGLTAAGAMAGVLVGGISSAGAVVASLVDIGGGGWVGVLLYRPALVTVPAAFLTMILVSRWTALSRPADAAAMLLRMHAPERLGLSIDRLQNLDRGN